jgi:hypothetical protein
MRIEPWGLITLAWASVAVIKVIAAAAMPQIGAHEVALMTARASAAPLRLSPHFPVSRHPRWAHPVRGEPSWFKFVSVRRKGPLFPCDVGCSDCRSELVGHDGGWSDALLFQEFSHQLERRLAVVVVERGCPGTSPSLSTACQTYNCLPLRRRAREPSPGSELAPWERVLSE